MNRPFNPTDEQQAILDHDPTRHARILAGPGTGKSATLVALLRRLHDQPNAKRLRMLTFTRNAAAELADKVAAGGDALPIKPTTIHSFAISVLLRNKGAADLPQPLRFADDWEEHNLIHRRMAKRCGVPVSRLRKLVREMASGWERLEHQDDPEVSPEERARFQGVWSEDRQLFGYTLLSELPYALRNALNDHDALDGVDLDLLIVDEYQDLNACDLDVIRMLGERGCSIVAAGDDDQSIYSFRCADPAGIRQFHSDYPSSREYPLSISQRSGRSLVEWATYVIAGDPDRPRKPPMKVRGAAAEGQRALLAFNNDAEELEGVCGLVKGLVDDEQVSESDIIILTRSDSRGMFSSPIASALQAINVPVGDPGELDRILGEPVNRRLVAAARLCADPYDSLAWATVLKLASGVGEGFADYVAEHARNARQRFGESLLLLHEAGYPDGPRSSNRAKNVVADFWRWLDDHGAVDDAETPWGEWMLAQSGGEVVQTPTPEFADLLLDLDSEGHGDLTLGGFVGQIKPLGADLRSSKNSGVRIMTMARAKGLTARATILVGLETGLVPRPRGSLAEERRLLYVAMTRSTEYLFGTWARRRVGRTARAGASNVGERRNPSEFLANGPVKSENGQTYLARRGWQR